MLCALAGTSYSRIPFGAQRHHHHCGHFPLSRSLLPSWNATLGALCSRQLCHTRSLTVANVCLWLASLNHRDVLGSPRGSDGVPTWRPATQGQAQDHGSHAPAAKHARVRVDPLRVSSAVRDNLERDGEGGAGGKYSRAEAGGGEATGARLRASVKANGDVSLGDTDRELNFALQQARAALAATSGDGDGGDDDGEDEGEGAPGYDSGDEDEAGGGKAGEGDEGVWQPRSSPTMRAVTADGVSRQRQRPGAGAGSGAGAASDGMQPARPPGTAPGVFGGAATSKGDSGRRAAFDEDGVSTESADYWENLLATLPDGGAQSATIDQVRVVGCCLARFVFSRSGMFAWFQILLHPSDVVVSSIVCNPSIEAVVVPPVKTRLLQFDALPADKVAALARRPLEAHLNQVITGLASGNSTPDRLAVLSYCFILARSAAMANFIVNSSLMALFVRMLGQRKCPVPIRARVALVMGAAVRHATFISVSLQSARVRVPLPPCRCFHDRVRAHHHPPCDARGTDPGRAQGLRASQEPPAAAPRDGRAGRAPVLRVHAGPCRCSGRRSGSRRRWGEAVVYARVGSAHAGQVAGVLGRRQAALRVQDAGECARTERPVRTEVRDAGDRRLAAGPGAAQPLAAAQVHCVVRADAPVSSCAGVAGAGAGTRWRRAAVHMRGRPVDSASDPACALRLVCGLCAAVCVAVCVCGCVCVRVCVCVCL